MDALPLSREESSGRKDEAAGWSVIAVVSAYIELMSSRAAVAAVAATAAAALVACAEATAPNAPPRPSFDLTLTEDTAIAYDFSHCTLLYCFKHVPKSSSLTAHLTFGPESQDLTLPECCPGTFVKAYDSVAFTSSEHDSLTGRAVVDDSGRVTVLVADYPFPTGYHSFELSGYIVDGSFSGRWKQWFDPHDLARLGSFGPQPAP